MRVVASVKFGIWMLIGLNLLMGFGSIWVFMRMAPAIEVIIDQNAVSLEACEEMLAALFQTADGDPDGSGEQLFIDALNRARNNVTESAEPPVLQVIESLHGKAVRGASAERTQVVAAILELGRVNRLAMSEADRRAQQLGNAGAWGVVFMSLSLLLTGLLLKRTIVRLLVSPLEEVRAVVRANNSGDALRRCSGADVPRDIRALYAEINEMLNNCEHRSAESP